MTATIVVGMQWGDEGKGKVTDYYAERADIVVRFQGGNNAGHTVIVGDQEYKLHILPCGILRPGKKAVIGNGVVMDPWVLLNEIETLKGMGLDTTDLVISDRANVIMPYHRFLDGMKEAQLGDKKIGTTGRGIGPTYRDKVARSGVRVIDLLDRKRLGPKLEENLQTVRTTATAHGLEFTSDPDLLEELLGIGKVIAPYVQNTTYLLNEALDSGMSILFEGAQGTFLDIDHGTYPFVTSSNTVAGGACSGAGVGPTRIDEVVGILKAYTTRVGEGPFPTELEDRYGEHLRDVGREFGVTTGRPRRCGWLDLVMARYSAKLNGVTSLGITKLDVLNGLDEIKVCTSYIIDGVETDRFPASNDLVESIEPVYTALTGWGSCETFDLSGGLDALPKEMQDYIELITSSLGVPAKLLSIGPERHMTIEVS